MFLLKSSSSFNYKDIMELFIKSLDGFCLNIVLYSYFASKQGYFLKPSISYCIDLICDCSQYLAILIDSKGFILKSHLRLLDLDGIVRAGPGLEQGGSMPIPGPHLPQCVPFLI